jgi:undecaprenyl diphosphate synthase
LTKIQHAVDLTRDNQRLILNVAFNYGGRAELVDAIQEMIRDGRKAEEVDEELVESYLYTAGLPDPDLVIRTGGEMRMSNFLLWQASYAEFYSTSTLWPDFDKDALYEALTVYNERNRRFGLAPQ